MKLGRNLLSSDLSYIINNNVIQRCVDYLVLDVYKYNDEYVIETLLIHYYEGSYIQEVIECSISSLNIHDLELIVLAHKFVSKQFYKDTRIYRSKEELYLHALMNYNANSFENKIKENNL